MLRRAEVFKVAMILVTLIAGISPVIVKAWEFHRQEVAEAKRHRDDASTDGLEGLFRAEADEYARKMMFRIEPTFEPDIDPDTQVVKRVLAPKVTPGETVEVQFGPPDGCAAVLINSRGTCVAMLKRTTIIYAPVDHLGIALRIPQVETYWIFRNIAASGPVILSEIVKDDLLPGDGGREGSWGARYESDGERVGALLTDGAFNLDAPTTIPHGIETSACITFFTPRRESDVLRVPLKLDDADSDFIGAALIEIDVSGSTVEQGLEARELAKSHKDSR